MKGLTRWLPLVKPRHRAATYKVLSMLRLIGLSLLLGVAGLSSGCAMCCAPNDCDYLATTGRWVRHNPTSGRVGSMFDEAGGPADVITTSATEPTPASAEPLPAPVPSPQSRMVPGNTGPYSAPGRMNTTPRSVVPRNMGETYLPRGN